MSARSSARRAWIARWASAMLGGFLVALLLPGMAGAAPAPSVSITDVVVAEGNAGLTPATFTLSLAPPRGSVTVNWATANGTATQPADYQSASGTVILTKTNKSVQVQVNVKGDALDENNETFLVNLTGGSIADPQGVGTITDDDLPPTLSIDDVSVAESDAGATATFRASLSGASGLPVSVNYATANGTAVKPGDYAAASGTLNFSPGEVQKPIDVSIVGDPNLESDETFAVNLSNESNATIADGQGIGTILDDDGSVTISIADASVTEGTGGASTISFDVSLTGPRGVPVAVSYATSPGSAGDPADFSGATGTTTFVPGDVAETIAVSVQPDSLDEADESFTVTLSGPVEATLLDADADAVGTIADDDKATTALTAVVKKTRRQITVSGILTPGAAGGSVSVTLYKKATKIASKSFALGAPVDSNGDAVLDQSYLVKLPTPKTRGRYKIVARFAGDADRKASSATKGLKV